MNSRWSQPRSAANPYTFGGGNPSFRKQASPESLEEGGGGGFRDLRQRIFQDEFEETGSFDSNGDG